MTEPLVLINAFEVPGDQAEHDQARAARLRVPATGWHPRACPRW